MSFVHAMTPDVQVQPDFGEWPALLAHATNERRGGAFLGKTASEWRSLTRDELGVAVDRPVIATGHEAVLWHPGILAKYIALDAWASHCGAACVHLVVDQHVGGFGSIDVPVRRDDGSLETATIQLGNVLPDVPMGWHPPLDPPAIAANVRPALPSVERGLGDILALVKKHRGAANAATQMTRVLEELLRPIVATNPLPGITATMLMTTTLARALVEAMAKDAPRAVAMYNAAAALIPEAGIAPLDASASELPLWRIDEHGRRQRAFVLDARAWLEDPAAIVLLPRALTMTALLRLGASDIFIHGFGGARYDPIMERWIADWLGVEAQPSVMVTATLRLPFVAEGETPLDVHEQQQHLRHIWHDPAAGERASAPSDEKARILREIASLPRNSQARRTRYLEMHRELERQRDANAAAVERARAQLRRAEQQQRDRAIMESRTWPFPFYPQAMIDDLKREISSRVAAGCGCESSSRGKVAVTSARSRAR